MLWAQVPAIQTGSFEVTGDQYHCASAAPYDLTCLLSITLSYTIVYEQYPPSHEWAIGKEGWVYVLVALTLTAVKYAVFYF